MFEISYYHKDATIRLHMSQKSDLKHKIRRFKAPTTIYLLPWYMKSIENQLVLLI